MAIVTTLLAVRLDRAVKRLPRAHPGPGGAVAVLRHGETLIRHAWGWANAERRIPFTPRTLFRLCSITKQFTCAALLDRFPDPSVLDGDVRARLPNLQQQAPGALDLCRGQSGLRDYFALAMLHGAPTEAVFGAAEAARIIAATRTLQFEPGTRFSYANQNFRLLSDILEARTGRGFAELLRSSIFDPAGMDTARLAADTAAMPDGTEGYEGTPEAGFRAAVNRITWTGDGGIAASLDDMIAWERHIDATRDDPRSLYRRIAAPVRFADGTPAAYGFGLTRSTAFGQTVTGHDGALRGWRSHRLYAHEARISVVVMLNHRPGAHVAALDLLAAALAHDRPPDAGAPPLAPPTWGGTYLEPETGLATRIDTTAHGVVRLRYIYRPERLAIGADGCASDGSVRLQQAEGGLWMDRPHDNHRALLRPRPGMPRPDIAGRYRCEALDTELTIADAGGVLYGGFSGFLGQGRMEMLEPVGQDLWALPHPRAMDHAPTGDWTLLVDRDDAGRCRGITVGNWLARRLRYDLIG
jgi:D-aminopeptidase